MGGLLLVVLYIGKKTFSGDNIFMPQNLRAITIHKIIIRVYTVLNFSVKLDVIKPTTVNFYS